MKEYLNDVQVVGLGQASIDYLGRVPFYPMEDEKIELIDFTMQCGGPASTALVTLSRFGICTSFLGSISDDFFGREILKGLKNEGVDATCLRVTPGFQSQFAFIAIDAKTGNRNIFWRRGSAPFLDPEDIKLEIFQNAEFLHLDDLMIDANIEAARQAKDMGLKVVMDAGSMRDNVLDLLPLINVLIASQNFITPIIGEGATPEDSLRTLRKFCTGDIIITLGSEGSMGLFDNEIVFQEAFPINAIDTTGAGDVYHGAYIYGLIKGWKMKECMRFASATAGLKCLDIGARKGIPNLDRVYELLKNTL
jgi:ribokinase